MFYLRADSTAQWSLTKLALMYKNEIEYNSTRKTKQSENKENIRTVQLKSNN